MLISEWAPCCRGALLEGSCHNCSNWSFVCTCLSRGGVGLATKRAVLSILLDICQGIWEDSKAGFVCSATSLLLVLDSVLCASDVRLLGFLVCWMTRKRKHVCGEWSMVWITLLYLSWTLNCRIVEFSPFSVFLKQQNANDYGIFRSQTLLSSSSFNLLCVKRTTSCRIQFLTLMQQLTQIVSEIMKRLLDHH